MNPNLFLTSAEELHAAALLALEGYERHWASVAQAPVVPAVTPRQMEALFDEPLPRSGAPLEQVVREAISAVGGHVTRMGHPRYFAFVNPGATSVAPLAELLAAGWNQNLGAWRNSPAGTAVEQRVLRWFAQMLGFPEGSGGILVSGGSMASLTAMGAALRARCPWDVRREGLLKGARPVTFYASEEVHRCVVKAAGLLGIGENAVRLVAVDDQCRLDLAALEAAVRKDRSEGALPIGVIGNAGTVNSGAVDDLEAIAEFCARESLWFHVDGAYGALAALAPTGRALLRGLERADSVALDPHKWLFLPYEAGACLVRDPALLKSAFGGHAAYMREDKAALAQEGERVDLFEYGPQLSRGFRALKIWMSLKVHGVDAYSQAIEHHLHLARTLDRLVEEHPRFELMSQAQLSISCFRWIPPGPAVSPEVLDEVQESLAVRLERSGEGFLSGTRLSGRAVLRTCILSFRTQESDLSGLLDSLDRLGMEWWKERSR